MSVIEFHQTGFIKGRFTGEKLDLYFIFYNNSNRAKLGLFVVDKEKAFDSLMCLDFSNVYENIYNFMHVLFNG